MAYRIDETRCVGCGACAWVCLFDVPAPTEAFGAIYHIDEDKCVGCGQCEDVCPAAAVSPLPGQRRIKNVVIDAEKCVGCSLCAHVCPAKAVHGELRKTYEINQEA